MIQRLLKFTTAFVLLWWKYQLRPWVKPSASPRSTDAAVMLTSHGKRLKFAWLTVAKIFEGTLLPSEVVIALPDSTKQIPQSLVRLRKWGLRTVYLEDFGPYTKWWHAPQVFEGSAVTHVAICDDDVLHAKSWFENLNLSMACLDGAYRQVSMIANGLLAQDPQSSPLEYLSFSLSRRSGEIENAICLGHLGFLLPIQLIKRIQGFGFDFLEIAPRQDDLYLSFALRALGAKLSNAGKVTEVVDNYLAWRLDALFPGNLQESGNNDALLRLTTHRWTPVAGSQPR